MLWNSWRKRRKSVWSIWVSDLRKSRHESLRVMRTLWKASFHQMGCLPRGWVWVTRRRWEWRETPSERIWVKDPNKASKTEVRPTLSGRELKVKTDWYQKDKAGRAGSDHGRAVAHTGHGGGMIWTRRWKDLDKTEDPGAKHVVRGEKGTAQWRKWTVIEVKMDSNVTWEEVRCENDVQDGTTAVVWEVHRVADHQTVKLHHLLHNRQQDRVGLTWPTKLEEWEPNVGIPCEEQR